MREIGNTFIIEGGIGQERDQGGKHHSMLIFLSPVPIHICCRLSWLLGGFPVLHTSDYTMESAYKVVFDDALEGALIIYKIPRYDVKGREILKTLEKYYLGDPSLLFAMMGYRTRFISGVLENMVMLELKRRGIRHKHIADFLIMDELI